MKSIIIGIIGAVAILGLIFWGGSRIKQAEPPEEVKQMEEIKQELETPLEPYKDKGEVPQGLAYWQVGIGAVIEPLPAQVKFNWKNVVVLDISATELNDKITAFKNRVKTKPKEMTIKETQEIYAIINYRCPNGIKNYSINGQITTTHIQDWLDGNCGI